MENNKVIVDIYNSGRNFSAYLPLLPGCVATGKTRKQVLMRIKDAVEFHVKSSLMDGDDIPAIFLSDYELVNRFIDSNH